MKETAISIETAGLELAEWVGRARREQTTFVLMDSKVPVARLVPTSPTRCTGADLARSLAKVNLSPVDAQAWADDIRESRAGLIPPEDRWR